MVWIVMLYVWERIKPDEAGQGQTEYAMLMAFAVFAALFALVGLGFAVYFLWDEIMSALPF